MQEVNVGIVGLGNVGSGALAILAENSDRIAAKLGFRLKVVAVCSRSVHQKELPAALGDVARTTDWREVVTRPDVQIVVELVGGTTVASEIVEAAIENRKSVVTANKELMAACGPRSGIAPSARESTWRWRPAFAAASPSMPCCGKASRAIR